MPPLWSSMNDHTTPPHIHPYSLRWSTWRECLSPRTAPSRSRHSRLRRPSFGLCVGSHVRSSWDSAMEEATALDSELREMHFRWAFLASGVDLSLCPHCVLVDVGAIPCAGGKNRVVVCHAKCVAARHACLASLPATAFVAGPACYRMSSSRLIANTGCRPQWGVWARVPSPCLRHGHAFPLPQCGNIGLQCGGGLVFWRRPGLSENIVLPWRVSRPLRFQFL